jgi:hypothetical protein
MEEFSKRLPSLLRAGVHACGKSTSRENPRLNGFLGLLRALETPTEAAKALDKDLDLDTATILGRAQLDVCEVCQKIGSLKDHWYLVTRQRWGGAPYSHFTCLRCEVCQIPRAYTHHRFTEMPGRLPVMECGFCASPTVDAYYFVTGYGRVVFMMYQALRLLKEDSGSR